jgi:cysteine desulfurase
MVYLDYAANTPADEEVLRCFCDINKTYIANPNSSHGMGKAAAQKMQEITERLQSLFGKEVIYTSGASEANNLAIKGITAAYRENGKHIITDCMEHSSVSGCLTYLQSKGYEIDMVDIKNDGTIDLEHLKELLREDTVLVSICYVEGELGIEQPIAGIAEIVKSYPNCFFHTDATQAMGKVRIDFTDIDLITFAPHKFYGLNGSGVLLKSDNITLVPLIHGGSSTTIYRSGTPDLPNMAALELALDKALKNFDERYEYVSSLNKCLRDELAKFPLIRINSPANANPYFLNVSVKGVKAAVFKEALEEYDICISIKSACSTLKTPSRPVYAVTKDKKNAMCSWRISLSHLTTMEEIKLFLNAFQSAYEKLT